MDPATKALPTTTNPAFTTGRAPQTGHLKGNEAFVGYGE